MRAGGQPSHLGAALRLAAAGVRRKGIVGGRPTVAAPARKLAVEREGIEVESGQLRRYLAATRAPATDDGAGTIPPTFASVWETALTLELLALEPMPFPSGGIVHMGSEVVSIRPLRLDDCIRCRLELERVSAHPRGALLSLKCRSWNASGHLCLENSASMLIRGVSPPPGSGRSGADRESSPAGGDEGEGQTWREVARWDLRGDAGVTYARSSGDFNPIHLWPWSARLLGFRRPILHGHCSLAMMAHELTAATGLSLRRMDARFRTPLEIPAAVRLEVCEGGQGSSLSTRLVDPDRPARPYVEGTWVGG